MLINNNTKLNNIKLILIEIFIIKYIESIYNIFYSWYSDVKYNKFKILEDSYLQILAEVPHLNMDKIRIDRRQDQWTDNSYSFIEELKYNKDWIRSWDPSKKWFNFPLIYRDKVIGLAKKLCPNTIKILKKIGSINIAGFSLLLPGCKLIPHCDSTGPSYNSMALNMMLDGKKSNLIVEYLKKNKYIHKNGKLVIFNSENIHYAENNGNTNRVILYIDFRLE